MEHVPSVKALDSEHTPSFRRIGTKDFLVNGLAKTSAI